jgi:hypothetical protein
MPTVKFLEPQVDEDESLGYVTKCGTFAAVPYHKGQFVIIHNGKQIRTCRNIKTAKTFITQELKKIK